MTDNTQDTNAQSAQPGDATGSNGGNERVMSQADIDRIVSERLARQRAQFSDYDQLKEQAAAWQKHLDAQKSEDERRAEQVKALERERDEAKQIAEQARREAQERLLQAAVIAAAGQARAKAPGDAWKLIDPSAVTMDEHGAITGAEEAVQALIEAGRLPTMDKPYAPGTDAGAGKGTPNRGSVKLTALEQQIARSAGMTDEEYAEYRDKGIPSQGV